MHESRFSLSKSQRRCVRLMLGRIRQARPAGIMTQAERQKLRTDVVNQLKGKLGREGIVTLFSPRTVIGASRSQHCDVCNRFTRHRNGECQEHDVKWCQHCERMMPHTSNGKCSRVHLHRQWCNLGNHYTIGPCTEHTSKYCEQCSRTTTHTDGKCDRSNMHIATSSSRRDPYRYDPWDD